MRTITFAKSDGDLGTAYLNKDIPNLLPENQVTDDAKIAKKLTKAKEYAQTKGKLVVGVASFTDADLTFYSDGTYMGRFWTGGFPFSGKYELE